MNTKIKGLTLFKIRGKKYAAKCPNIPLCENYEPYRSTWVETEWGGLAEKKRRSNEYVEHWRTSNHWKHRQIDTLSPSAASRLTNLVYQVQSSTNLVSNAWTIVGYIVLGGGPFCDEITNTIPVVLDQTYIRLKVER